MEDGGLAIVDEHGELRHVTAARVATSVRYLLARLQTEAGSDIPRRMAFTSTLSGEGVTFIANSFASVLAHDLARRVCVVDLNWWSAGNGESKDGGEPRPGMFEVLWRETDIADVLVATQTPNLWLLPPGRAPLSVRPALARNELLADMLNQLDQHFDHLVFDLPAVLVTSDAIALASLCDGFVLVVRQGMASRPQIRGALESMRGVPPLGIVLNSAHEGVPRFLRRAKGF
jgi:Mrp family chromosome partitioning ATPase